MVASGKILRENLALNLGLTKRIVFLGTQAVNFLCSNFYKPLTDISLPPNTHTHRCPVDPSTPWQLEQGSKAAIQSDLKGMALVIT